MLPCYCGHEAEKHNRYDWVFNPDHGVETVEFCEDCREPFFYCNGVYNSMTNLEYLEWKANDKEVDNNEVRS